MPNTTSDFWRMIWEKRLPNVVMLTKCMEAGRVSTYAAQVWTVLGIECWWWLDNKLSITTTYVLPLADFTLCNNVWPLAIRVPKLWSKTNQLDKERVTLRKSYTFAIKYHIHASNDIVWAFLSRNFNQFYSTIVICTTNKKTVATRMVKFVCKLLDTHSSVYAEKVVYFQNINGHKKGFTYIYRLAI